MNKIVSVTSALLFAGAAGMALAQTSTATPSAPAAPSAQATPMKHMMGKGDHPRINELRARFEEQNKRIWAGFKHGKLTKDEAEALHAKVKSIREEMQGDVKSNGDGGLTEDQFKQLNQELDENSAAIHDEKTEGSTGSAPAPAAATTPAAN
jgi:predicted RNase H-like nuclease (RuvC/YqgF family)